VKTNNCYTRKPAMLMVTLGGGFLFVAREGWRVHETRAAIN